jgi:Protein of unknown function (DUF4236)/HIRAN domain
MGLRFFRRIRIAPGFHVNLSKRGVSLSAGRRGLGFSVGSRGARTTVGLPGTGLSFTATTGKRRRKRKAVPAPESRTKQRAKFNIVHFIIGAFIFFALLWAIVGETGIWLIIAAAAVGLTIYVAAKFFRADESSPLARQAGDAIAMGDGAYRYEVVGESHYQTELAAIVGGRTEDSASHECAAVLVPEPNNPYDPNAIYVCIGGHKVGYLARDCAVSFGMALAQEGYGEASCRALIVGGWDRGKNDQGSFGVKLDIALPLHIQSAS